MYTFPHSDTLACSWIQEWELGREALLLQCLICIVLSHKRRKLLFLTAKAIPLVSSNVHSIRAYTFETLGVDGTQQTEMTTASIVVPTWISTCTWREKLREQFYPCHAMQWSVLLSGCVCSETVRIVMGFMMRLEITTCTALGWITGAFSTALTCQSVQ